MASSITRLPAYLDLQLVSTSAAVTLSICGLPLYNATHAEVRLALQRTLHHSGMI